MRRPVIYSALVCCVSLALTASLAATSGAEEQPLRKLEANLKQNVSEEMHLIKSLEDLLGELGQIKREATGRLSSVKRGGLAPIGPDQVGERIRQTKVSRFVLNRVAELESESMGMRDELAKLFQSEKKLQPQASDKRPLALYADPLRVKPKQEDLDFDEEPATSAAPATTTTTEAASGSSEGMPATSSTAKPASDEEAAKLGFDMEALKKLGAELETELEARQQQNPESLRGVHEQVIRLVDNMVQNYLGNVRRTIQRMTNFIDNQRNSLSGGQQPRQQQQLRAPGNHDIETEAVISGQFVEGFANIRQSILNRIQSVSKNMHEFTMQWTRAVGKQQSPLIDRIPPRGVELWRDFWDTVRKQVRRINQEFYQLSQDMSRMVTGRLPAGPRPDAPFLYSSSTSGLEELQSAARQFQQFYNKMSASLNEAQLQMDSVLGGGSNKAVAAPGAAVEAVGSMNRVAVAANNNDNGLSEDQNNLIDESDDEATKTELTRNVALRQQIQQEINIFGSIFDIMRTFIQRLRESASNVVRDVMNPSATNNNSNDPVTPGPSVKPQVDKLLEETIESQRLINGQAQPVLLPNKRPVVNPTQG